MLFADWEKESQLYNTLRHDLIERLLKFTPEIFESTKKPKIEELIKINGENIKNLNSEEKTNFVRKDVFALL